MTGHHPASRQRHCTSCDAVIPATRSVCPECGRLQKPRPIPGITDVPGEPATPPGSPGTAPGSELGAGAAWPPNRPTAAARPDASPPAAARPTASTATLPERRAAPVRRSGRRVAGAFVVLALLAAGAGAWWVLRDPYEAGDTVVERVDRFCGKPRALGDEVAEFVPGEPAAAHLEVPQPASSMEEPRTVTAPASPVVGEATLDLEASVGLVSLAVCLSEASSQATDAMCDYELTNDEDRGRLVRAPLLAVTYQAELYELRTGTVLASGEVATATDACPELSYVEAEGVANPLPADAVVLWLASRLPGGVPT